MALPAEYEFQCYSGDTLSRSMAFTDENDDAIDLSGYTVAMKIRARPDSAEVDDWGSLWDTTNAATGILVLTVPAATTAALDAGHYYYDLELTTGSTVTTYLAGPLMVTMDVTR